MNVYSFSMALFSFGVLLISILALVKRKDKVALRFMIFSLAVSGWGFFCSFWISQNYAYESTLFLTRIGHVFANFIPIAWVHFVFEFIEKKEPIKHFYLSCYLVAALFGLIAMSPIFISGLHPIAGLKLFPTAGLVYHFYTIFFLMLVPYAFYHLVKLYVSASGQVKNQLGYFILATSIGFGVSTTAFLAGYKVPFSLWPFMVLPIYPFLMGIALIRYGLFDPQRLADAFQKEKLAAIGILASSLNHELRNPLFVVRGKIESHFDAIERQFYSSPEDEREKTKETLNAALNHLNRAMDMMQRFTEFSKPLEDNKAREAVMIREVLNDVIHLVSNEIELQKINLTVASMNDLNVFANRRQLEEIFFNLIVNACQAMGDNGGELSISAYKTDRKTCVEISDMGPGISKKDQAKIFNPFYSTKGSKGTGLGLYITKQLVERNGGKIFIASKRTWGACFVVEFPNISKEILKNTDNYFNGLQLKKLIFQKRNVAA